MPRITVRSSWEGAAMFDKLRHHKLLTEGLEGEGTGPK